MWCTGHNLSSVRTRLASIWYCQPSPPDRRNWMPCNGSQGTCSEVNQLFIDRPRGRERRTFTILISKRTLSALCAMLSNVTRSISPEVLIGDARSEGVERSLELTDKEDGRLMKEDGGPEGMSVGAVTGLMSVGSGGTSGTMRGWCGTPFGGITIALSGRSASRALPPKGKLRSWLLTRRMLKESRDTRLVMTGCGTDATAVSPEDGNDCSPRKSEAGVDGASMEDTSTDGRWMHSKPLLFCQYRTCMRSRTRRISALITGGGLVDVVATLPQN